ncbi:T6SS amidase immunity protein Tai4 family protein [Photobacterium kagoshimensis]|uniref:T6SS amidase immunity protein Tai4 family protein n=1 Tax=Photobacterium kagoshimensis TaxID=2910242 RepID=UPI003D0B575C
METGRLVSAIFIAFCSLGANASPLSSQSDEQLFKSFALSSCIATYYKGSDVANDALTAMQGYREFSNLSLDAFFEVSEVLRSENMAVYKSKDGRAIELAYCIDFSQSAEVHALYIKAKSDL